MGSFRQTRLKESLVHRGLINALRRRDSQNLGRLSLAKVRTKGTIYLTDGTSGNNCCYPGSFHPYSSRLHDEFIEGFNTAPSAASSQFGETNVAIHDLERYLKLTFASIRGSPTWGLFFNNMDITIKS